MTQVGGYPTAWANHILLKHDLHIRVRMNSELTMDYEVRDYQAYGEKRMFQSYDGPNVSQTDDIEAALLLVKGWIKWDGCSHNEFMPEDKGYIHACSRSELVRFGVLFNALYDLLLERLPHHKETLK